MKSVPGFLSVLAATPGRFLTLLQYKIRARALKGPNPGISRTVLQNVGGACIDFADFLFQSNDFVAPIIILVVAIALFPSMIAATTGPDVIKDVSSPKNGLSL